MTVRGTVRAALTEEHSKAEIPSALRRCDERSIPVRVTKRKQTANAVCFSFC